MFPLPSSASNGNKVCLLNSLAQGLLHMGKGLIGVMPYHGERSLMSPVAVAGLLVVLHSVIITPLRLVLMLLFFLSFQFFQFFFPLSSLLSLSLSLLLLLSLLLFLLSLSLFLSFLSVSLSLSFLSFLLSLSFWLFSFYCSCSTALKKPSGVDSVHWHRIWRCTQMADLKGLLLGKWHWLLYFLVCRFAPRGTAFPRALPLPFCQRLTPLLVVLQHVPEDAGDGRPGHAAD